MRGSLGVLLVLSRLGLGLAQCIRHTPQRVLVNVTELRSFRVENSLRCIDKCAARRSQCRAALHHRLPSGRRTCAFYGANSEGGARLHEPLVLAGEEFNLYEILERCERSGDRAMASWSSWEAWAACPAQCEQISTRRRRRRCSAPGACSGLAEDSQPCKGPPCVFARNVSAPRSPPRSPGGPVTRVSRAEEKRWDRCSTTCGPGTRVSVKDCEKEDCQGSPLNIIPCNMQPCPPVQPALKLARQPKSRPSRGSLETGRPPSSSPSRSKSKSLTSISTGQEWGQCSVTCGVGSVIKRKKCPPSNPNCKAGVLVLSCDAGPCTTDKAKLSVALKASRQSLGVPVKSSSRLPVYGSSAEEPAPPDVLVLESGGEVWEEWEDWSDCDCQRGMKRRAQRCPLPNGCPSQEDKCSVEEMLSSPCGLGQPTTTEAPTLWLGWSGWSDCTASCGRGHQRRRRACLSGLCDGTSREERSCAEVSCTGAWSPWEAWSECTQSCGGGMRARMRQCDGLSCAGKSSESAICSPQSCASWSEWGSWGPCSSSCGVGAQSRTRDCFGGNCAEGQPIDTQQCDAGQCASWTPWGSWSPCSASCGEDSSRTRVRVCLAGDSCQGEPTEMELCPGMPSCSSWAPWAPWSSCSVTCGLGTEQRVRGCNGGECLGGEPVESRPCDRGGCWREWGTWSTCSSSCGAGQIRRSRECGQSLSSIASLGVDSYGSSSSWSQPLAALKSSAGKSECIGKALETAACDSGPCSSWTSWSPWTSCSVTCDQGIETRARVCNGGGCPGKTSEIKGCTLPACPSWSSWGAWEECAVSCGQGMRSRARNCMREACVGRSVDKQVCDAGPCPEWVSWGAWTLCSRSCGKGTRTRSRDCEGGSATLCFGSSLETGTCDAGPCSEWGGWGPWLACSHSCGAGVSLRERKCMGAEDGRKHCIGQHSETRECRLKATCPEWGPWSEWGECSVSCGKGGQEHRTRQCSDDGHCQGSSLQTEACDKEACPTWSPWSDWSGCSASCGPGRSLRKRTCDGGNTCVGDSTNTQDCIYAPCPYWSAWLSWTACTTSCGGGERFRERSCQGSGECPGDAREGGECGMDECPAWESWQPWSECSVSCGFGGKKRNRFCTRPGLCNGPSTESMSCQMGRCCAWEGWAPWSGCSTSCGNGEKRRGRKCSCDAGYGQAGPGEEDACDGPSDDTDACQAGPCPMWMPWMEWSTCTATCGDSTRFRQRECTHFGRCEGDDNEVGLCTFLPPCAAANPARPPYGAPQPPPRPPPYRPPAPMSYANPPATQPPPSPYNEGYAIRRRTGIATPGQLQAPQPPPYLPQPQGPPVSDCQWSAWDSWSLCSSSCGAGRQSRRRQCQCGFTIQGAEECGGGREAEQAECTTGPCPSWQPWAEWTDCGLEGMRSRSRICTHGLLCGPGDSVQSERCFPGPPSYPGSGQGSFPEPGPHRGSFSSPGPPQGSFPGFDVPSSLPHPPPLTTSEFQLNSGTGPITSGPSWTSWDEWTHCSATCGTGTRVRGRSCTVQGFCDGEFIHSESCEAAVFCPSGSGGLALGSRGPPASEGPGLVAVGGEGNCELGEWRSWSPCSLSCAELGASGGKQTRERSCSCLGPADNCDPRSRFQMRPCSSLRPCPDALVRRPQWGQPPPRPPTSSHGGFGGSAGFGGPPGLSHSRPPLPPRGIISGGIPAFVPPPNDQFPIRRRFRMSRGN